MTLGARRNGLCIVCGKPFSWFKRAGDTRNRALCSDACRDARKKEHRRRHAATAKRADWVRRKPKTFTCVMCSALFQSRQTKATCCSTPCARRRIREQVVGTMRPSIRIWPNKQAKWAMANYRRQARLSSGPTEQIDPLIVFERDGWICQICHHEIDRSAKWPHRSSPSVDHIVPLSRGGDHTWANVQCAHLGCNSSKCDGRRALAHASPSQATMPA